MSRLDFEQQKKRAKDLLRASQAGDAKAIARLETVRRGRPKLADAQLVIAREAGFASWVALKRFVEHEPEPAPLERAVRARDAGAVAAVLAAGAEKWLAREALELAVEYDDREIAKLLLAYGSWPDHAGRRWGHGGGCLHAALLLGRPRELLEVLVAGGASPAAIDRDGRTPRAIAVRTAGPDMFEVGEDLDLDRALGACVRGEHPARGDWQLRVSDHQHVCWAVRRAHHAALPALLALGLDPSVPDDDGETPLHLAVSAHSLVAIDALLAGGARVDGLDFRDETPLMRAERQAPELVDRLVRAGAVRRRRGDVDVLFEQAADAVVAGDLPKLTALLDREPRLATAHSPRSHRATLLHYVGANGVEGERQKSPPNAGAVAELLLARGAKPNALAHTYGGGPSQTPLLLAVTSVHPAEAGVMADIVGALVRGGATVDGVDGDHAPIHQARRDARPALVAAGARIDLPIAAALGMRDRVAAFLAGAPDAKIGANRARSDADVRGEALREAAAAGHVEIVGDLLAVGAPLDSRDPQGMTPLHHAAWQCRLDAARALIAAGAPLEAKNDYGGTVLDMLVWAIHHERRGSRDYPAMVQLLIDAGADLAAVSGVPTEHADVDEVFRRAGKIA